MPSSRLYEGDLATLMNLLTKMDGHIVENSSAITAIVNDLCALRETMKSVSIDRVHPGQCVNNNADQCTSEMMAMTAGNSTQSAGQSADRTAAATSWSHQSSQQMDWATKASLISSPIVQSNRFAALDCDVSSDDHSDNNFVEQRSRRSAKRRRRQRSMLNQQVQQPGQDQSQHQQSRSEPVTAA